MSSPAAPAPAVLTAADKVILDKMKLIKSRNDDKDHKERAAKVGVAAEKGDTASKYLTARHAVEELGGFDVQLVFGLSNLEKIMDSELPTEAENAHLAAALKHVKRALKEVRILETMMRKA